jgi:intracellular sulfur oxidation DsrE/DsrF family protein
MRRSFLGRVMLGAAGVVGLAGSAAAEEAGPGRFMPMRHPEDDWMDQIPGKHRMVFDTASTHGAGESLFFARNLLMASGTGYGLKDNDVAVIIILRHQSTSFGYNDSLWAKYGSVFAKRTELMDPKTNQAPTVNLFNKDDSSGVNRGVSVPSLAARGVHFAICRQATGNLANQVAQATGQKADDVVKEIIANIAPNGHMVPAGIVALNHAQERGYVFGVGTA